MQRTVPALYAARAASAQQRALTEREAAAHAAMLQSRWNYMDGYRVYLQGAADALRGIKSLMFGLASWAGGEESIRWVAFLPWLATAQLQTQLV